jgi:hypothetical protein
MGGTGMLLDCREKFKTAVFSRRKPTSFRFNDRTSILIHVGNLPRRTVVVETREAEVTAEQLVVGVGADKLKIYKNQSEFRISNNTTKEYRDVSPHLNLKECAEHFVLDLSQN